MCTSMLKPTHIYIYIDNIIYVYIDNICTYIYIIIIYNIYNNHGLFILFLRVSAGITQRDFACCPWSWWIQDCKGSELWQLTSIHFFQQLGINPDRCFLSWLNGSMWCISCCISDHIFVWSWSKGVSYIQLPAKDFRLDNVFFFAVYHEACEWSTHHLPKRGQRR